MRKRAYTVVWRTDDGQTVMETLTGRNHRAVARSIFKKGGTVISIDRSESAPPNPHQMRDEIFAVLICTSLLALLVVIILRLSALR